MISPRKHQRPREGRETGGGGGGGEGGGGGARPGGEEEDEKDTRFGEREGGAPLKVGGRRNGAGGQEGRCDMMELARASR